MSGRHFHAPRAGHVRAFRDSEQAKHFSPLRRLPAALFAEVFFIQSSLSYFLRCVDFQRYRDEIDHPIFVAIGSRDLTEQLAPRKNAKAPRNVFVGSSPWRWSQCPDIAPAARVSRESRF
ncbi:MAG: hypothetical protein WA177_23215 [Xanthobacteraceae bacterium]